MVFIIKFRSNFYVVYLFLTSLESLKIVDSKFYIQSGLLKRADNLFSVYEQNNVLFLML